MNALARLSPLPPLRRGVWKYRRKIFGRNAYLAVTSELHLVHGAVFVTTDEVSDAQLVVWLNDELKRLDPLRPPLQLVPRTVAASLDGPSVSHPEIARLEEARREMIDVPPVEEQPWFAERYPEGHIMRGVCERLSRLENSSA